MSIPGKLRSLGLYTGAVVKHKAFHRSFFEWHQHSNFIQEFDNWIIGTQLLKRPFRNHLGGLQQYR